MAQIVLKSPIGGQSTEEYIGYVANKSLLEIAEGNGNSQMRRIEARIDALMVRLQMSGLARDDLKKTRAFLAERKSKQWFEYFKDEDRNVTERHVDEVIAMIDDALKPKISYYPEITLERTRLESTLPKLSHNEQVLVANLSSGLTDEETAGYLSLRAITSLSTRDAAQLPKTDHYARRIAASSYMKERFGMNNAGQSDNEFYNNAASAILAKGKLEPRRSFSQGVPQLERIIKGFAAGFVENDVARELIEKKAGYDSVKIAMIVDEMLSRMDYAKGEAEEQLKAAQSPEDALMVAAAGLRKEEYYRGVIKQLEEIWKIRLEAVKRAEKVASSKQFSVDAIAELNKSESLLDKYRSEYLESIFPLKRVVADKIVRIRVCLARIHQYKSDAVQSLSDNTAQLEKELDVWGFEKDVELSGLIGIKVKLKEYTTLASLLKNNELPKKLKALSDREFALYGKHRGESEQLKKYKPLLEQLGKQLRELRDKVPKLKPSDSIPEDIVKEIDSVKQSYAQCKGAAGEPGVGKMFSSAEVEMIELNKDLRSYKNGASLCLQRWIEEAQKQREELKAVPWYDVRYWFGGQTDAIKAVDAEISRYQAEQTKLGKLSVHEGGK